jgi:uncharacterized protein YegJ (DUF2314 family)
MGLWSWLKGLFGGSTEKSGPRGRKKEQKSRAKGDEKPLISLVLLLREQRYLDQRIVTRLVNEAWDADLGEDDPEATDFVVGEAPSFIIQFRGRNFLVNTFPRPYVDKPEEAAEEITELRLRKVFGEHRAWLSVDLLGDTPDENDRPEIYGLIGKLTAALADDDCLALYSPATDQMVPYDPALEEKLRGPDALEVFAWWAQAPVAAIRGEDPRMQAAQAEARRRWPEFVAAFERRGPGQRFAAKAPFEDGDYREFMWLMVTALEGDFILGRLDNDPVDVRTVRRGSRVRVDRRTINDWLFTEGDDMQGGFTIKAIQQIQNETRSEIQKRWPRSGPRP